MQAVFYAGHSHIDVREVPTPEPKPGEVLLRIRASAVCGSELHDYRGPHASQGIAGHEGAGEIVALGASCGLAVGQRVAVQVFSGCGSCEYCVAGDPEHCAQSRFHGGTHAEYMVVPASCCLPLPDDVPFDQGVLLGGDTIGTPYHALARLHVSSADTVGVFGCGPVGLGSIAVLRFLGARILAVESLPYRRELAQRLGASVALDPADGDPVKRIRELTGGRGVSVALDCSGSPATTTLALESVGIHGRMAFIGEKPEATVRPSPQFIRKELTAIGSWYFTAADYFHILELYRRGLQVADLATHRFPLAQADEAFATFASGQSGKVLLVQ
ncbi:MAG: zinc-binding dehydrogenase [Chloroflexi bacterium]|jgi:threonine dehydrogenase-like Zn-dependent dehydrogenase|nr:zinc-binding dehydrogenase [Chloroflexota bacterium]